jgi:hypothetical protein
MSTDTGAHAKYRLRYAFDAGAGVCLWAGNDAARARFGYPIEAAALPLTDTTRQQVEKLIVWYDTGIDWMNPGGPSPWDAAEEQRFQTAARALAVLLEHELGPEFDLVDESAISG